MASLSLETIQELAHLCRIRCSPKEQEAWLEDLEKILVYAELLQEVDTSGVEPCYQVLADGMSPLRRDMVEAPLSRELFLANAPSQIGGMVRVPPIIKESL